MTHIWKIAVGCALITAMLALSQKLRSKEVSTTSIRRRLQHVPKTSWFRPGESLETSNGNVPMLSCPLGKYRITTAYTYNRRPGGLREDGCIECPRGKFGSTTDLTSSDCTGNCPKGTYRDVPGGITAADCFYCPEGTFGSVKGLVNEHCSGMCSDLNDVNTKWYSNVAGLTQSSDCLACPEGYRGWQCEWDHEDRKNEGTENGFAGFGQDKAHAYIKKGNDGSWAGKKYDGDWSGAWPNAGAIPENKANYVGQKDTFDEDGRGVANGVGNFNPAKPNLHPIP